MTERGTRRHSARVAVLLLGLLIASSLAPHPAVAQTTPTGPTPVTTPATTLPYPNAQSLMQRSLAAIHSSLRTVHGVHTTTVRDTTQHQKSTLRLEGNCALTPSSLAIHVTWGGSFSSGPPFSVEYVVIASRKTSHAWMHSTRTGNGWTSVDFGQIGGEILPVCPSLLLRQFATVDLRGLKDLGPASIDGRATWRLHARMPLRGEVNTADFYLDQSSLYPVRIALGQTRGSFHARTVVRYTSFNAAVHISPPAAPSAPPSLGRGSVTAWVTPNPMPGSATPTLTVAAASGSRCSARVVYQTSTPATAPPTTVGLGTRRVGRNGQVQWTWHVPARAFGGNAIVRCSRGRNTTVQATSFFIFS